MHTLHIPPTAYTDPYSYAAYYLDASDIQETPCAWPAINGTSSSYTNTTTTTRNRTLSIRSRKEPHSSRHRFSINTFRGMQGPELSRKLSRLIKSENSAIGAYETAGRERTAIASQLSEWGESTDDDAVSDISDKLGVMLAEMGEQEDVFAQNLEDYRGVLKHIRNMEASVQPSRDQRQKVTDEIAKLKWKDPNSTRITTLEHELVRAEAQNLVAEAQLSNTVCSASDFVVVGSIG